MIEENKKIVERKKKDAIINTEKLRKEETDTEGWSEQKSKKARRKQKNRIANQGKVTQTGRTRGVRKPNFQR